MQAASKMAVSLAALPLASRSGFSACLTRTLKKYSLVASIPNIVRRPGLTDKITLLLFVVFSKRNTGVLYYRYFLRMPALTREIVQMYFS